MKINVIKRKFKSVSEDWYNISYKIRDCVYCCEGIKCIPNIDFYYECAENTHNPFEDDGCDKDLGIMLEETRVYNDGWYDDCDFEENYYYKLDYCPCCGEKIEVEVVNNVDVSDEFIDLKKERDKVHKKCMNTDSKKKEQEYLNQRRELDMKIESFYHTDCLPDRNNY